MLHGANPDEAVSARGPIAIRYRFPSFGFLKEYDFSRAEIFGFSDNFYIFKKKQMKNGALLDSHIYCGDGIFHDYRFIFSLQR